MVRNPTLSHQAKQQHDDAFEFVRMKREQEFAERVAAADKRIQQEKEQQEKKDQQKK